MNIYEVKFNDFGIHHMVAHSYEEAERLFLSNWRAEDLPEIKSITKLLTQKVIVKDLPDLIKALQDKQKEIEK